MKIVSLLPSATELVCALGLEQYLVAVSHECDHPRSIGHLPRITRSIIPSSLEPAGIDRAVVDAVRSGQALYTVDADMLARLAPDLIVTQGVCDVCAVNVGTVSESLRMLDEVIAIGVRTVSLDGKTFRGVLDDLERLADATGCSSNALSRPAEERWHAIAARINGPRRRVAVLEWPDPLFFGGHWVPEMIDAAGGEDLFGVPGKDSGRLTHDEIVARDPEIIVSAACGYDLEANHRFALDIAGRPALAGVSAVRDGEVWAVDANGYFSRPTLRIVDGAETLQAILSAEASSVVAHARRALA